jgi:hypothetical protein
MTDNTMAVTVPEKTQGVIDRLDQWAKKVVVTTDLQRTAVLGVVKDVKIQRKALNEIFDPNIKKAHALHKSLVAQKKQFTDRLEKAEKAGKDAVLIYDEEQERKRREEQRRLQADADERARKERERLQKRAEKLKTPEKKEALLEESAEIVAPVVQVAEPEKVEGVSKKTTWKARVIDVDKVPRQFMEVNMTALNALARSTKGTMKIEGVEFYEESTLAIR